VRWSVEGWAAGDSIPARADKAAAMCLQNLWRRCGASAHAGARLCRAWAGGGWRVSPRACAYVCARVRVHVRVFKVPQAPCFQAPGQHGASAAHARVACCCASQVGRAAHWPAPRDAPH
jgi:hypothetical protein